MPAYGVTVTATFTKTADQVTVETAQSTINTSWTSATVAQADAATVAALKTWLVGQINPLITGITVTDGDVTVASFTAAAAGTASTPSGTNGSYSFTVKLKLPNSTEVITTSKSGTITATAYVSAQAPIISAQPETATTVTTGASVALTVTAGVTDGGTLSYQWYSNTTNSNTGGTPTGSNAAGYSPPTSSTGTLYYYVEVTNTNTGPGITGATTATTTSQVAAVTVNNLVNAQMPVIATQPTAATVNAGANVTLTVTAGVTDGGVLSYKWYSNTANSNTGGTLISSATGSSYVPSTSTAGTLYYYVVITNTNALATGSQTAAVTSAPAGVTVNPVTNAQTPVISGHPQNATVNAGASVTLTVTAGVTDGGTLSYQWYRNTSGGNSGGTAVGGATAGSYAPPTSTIGTAYYYVVITNRNTTVSGAQTATTTSNTASVVVSEPAQPTYAIGVVTPTNGTVALDKTAAKAGETVTLTLTPANGYETVSVRAYRTGSESTSVALSGTGNSRSFTMPAYGVTVAATFGKTKEQLDKEAVEDAKVAIGGGTYQVAQATGNTESAVKTWLAGVLNILLGNHTMGNTGLYSMAMRTDEVITVNVADITTLSFAQATAGTEASPEGANGQQRCHSDGCRYDSGYAVYRRAHLPLPALGWQLCLLPGSRRLPQPADLHGDGHEHGQPRYR